MLAHQAIFVGGVALIPPLIEWQWPTWYELVLLVLVGVISSIGQWFGVTAYKWGEANMGTWFRMLSSHRESTHDSWLLLYAELPNTIAVIVFSAIMPFVIKLKKGQ
ncbi:hypothetical protein [Vibrio splendidus]|uniref:hypothetical protein n=1 Tax=Vibrio splendidus TaxID=29497 RepID=UPI000AD66CF1|nr:hypothetical protein [Vibrio splendidus]PHX03648.1 hypothetical protein VSPL_49180 [Vibrio splendidus]